MINFLSSQFSWSSAKAVFAAVFAGACSAFSVVAGWTHPSIPFLIALVCIDFVLAAGTAIRENRFTWPGFWRGLGKFLAYSLIFIVTTLADQGLGIAGWFFNLTVGVSCYAIAGESISCLKHIDNIFPGQLPCWVIERLLTFRASIERDNSGYSRRKDDWRGYWRENEGNHEDGTPCPPPEDGPPEDRDSASS